MLSDLSLWNISVVDYSMDDLPFEVYLTKGQSGLGMSLTGGDNGGMSHVHVSGKVSLLLHTLLNARHPALFKIYLLNFFVGNLELQPVTANKFHTEHCFTKKQWIFNKLIGNTSF